jgi:hypothetical protein
MKASQAHLSKILAFLYQSGSSFSKIIAKPKALGPCPSKKAKTKNLIIHERTEFHPENLPLGPEFISYKDHFVQDLVFTNRYRKIVKERSKRVSNVRSMFTS